MELIERFILKTKKSTSGCLEWTGGRIKIKGYGRFVIKHIPEYAHRIAYELFIGPIPDGVWVLRRCNNPLCVSPDHLILRTTEEKDGDTKRCVKCGETKLLNEFSQFKPKDAKRKLRRPRCRACMKAYSIDCRKSPREKNQRRTRKLARRYGMTVTEYAIMLDGQAGVCAICGHHETHAHHISGDSFRLSVDHEHATGKVRGLLCKSCNTGIGDFKDDPVRLRAAAAYLEAHR